MKLRYLVFVLLLAAPVYGQKITVPLTPNDGGGFSVPIVVQGKPFMARIDTGAGVVVLRHEFKKVPGRLTPLRVGGFQYGSAESALMAHLSVCLGTVCKNVIVIMDKNARDNLLGLNFFTQFGKMTLDFSKNTLTLEQP